MVTKLLVCVLSYMIYFLCHKLRLIYFCFKGREELTSCLRGCLYSIPGQEADLDLEEGAKEMVELAMRKLDLDRDGSIKFHDFHEAVNDDPLLLQAIGKCLSSFINWLRQIEI